MHAALSEPVGCGMGQHEEGCVVHAAGRRRCMRSPIMTHRCYKALQAADLVLERGRLLSYISLLDERLLRTQRQLPLERLLLKRLHRISTNRQFRESGQGSIRSGPIRSLPGSQTNLDRLTRSRSSIRPSSSPLIHHGRATTPAASSGAPAGAMPRSHHR